MYAVDESKLNPHYYYYGDDHAPDLTEEDSRAEADAFVTRVSLPFPSTKLPPHENNFTKYDLKIMSIDVTLDLVRWLDGKGIVKSASLRGVRGVIDRRDVFWDENTPEMPRRMYQRGDFEFGRVTLEDLFLTVYNPKFRPYGVSIFNADLPKLRKQWLLYDLICAASLVGLFDNCLFSLHTPQRYNLANENSGKGVPESRLVSYLYYCFVFLELWLLM
jgi:distribution and morphology protein 31